MSGYGTRWCAQQISQVPQYFKILKYRFITGVNLKLEIMQHIVNYCLCKSMYVKGRFFMDVLKNTSQTCDVHVDIVINVMRTAPYLFKEMCKCIENFYYVSNYLEVYLHKQLSTFQPVRLFNSWYKKMLNVLYVVEIFVGLLFFGGQRHSKWYTLHREGGTIFTSISLIIL